MKVKVCGLVEPENIKAVEALGVDLLGFVFYAPSPRYVERATFEQFYEISDGKAMQVGVFVGEDPNQVAAKARNFSLDYVQLHGEESPEYCRRLHEKGVQIIKAFTVDADFDFKSINAYATVCDYFLFDGASTGRFSETQSFDWSLLKQYTGRTPFFIGGNLTPNSLSALQKFQHPQWIGVDLSTGFEASIGVKDIAVLQTFIDQFRESCSNLSHK